MTAQEFAKSVNDRDNIFPKGTDAQRALEILTEHFLGELPILAYPASVDQWNSEAVYAILEKYPKGKIRRI